MRWLGVPLVVLTVSGCDLVLGLERNTVVDAAIDSPLTCPTHYVAFAELTSRYRIIDSISPYNFQKDACAADGTHLAAIDATDELSELRARANAVATATRRDFWVGVVQDPSATEEDEGWFLVTGEPLDPLLWEIGQPNDNSDGIEDGQENAATIDVDYSGLGDNSMGASHGAICECDGKPAVR